MAPLPRSLLVLLPLALLGCEPEPSGGPAASASSGKAPAPPAASSALAPAPPPPVDEVRAKPADQPAPPDVGGPPADAVKTASGLASKVLTPGTGKEHPRAESSVTVSYTGWLKAGRMFDSTAGDGKPRSVRMPDLVKGLSEGLKLMVKGEKRRLWIPSALAYGDPPRMVGAPGGPLVFDVELVDIVAPGKPPPTPEDVRAAPPAATRTATGLAYRLLKKGEGTRKPRATDSVTVNYTGWKPDGKMFESTATDGVPQGFSLEGVIKGWTEGLQLMNVGDVMRFWVPSELAYGDHPSGGRPGGPLVFDVELVSIK